MLQVQIHSRCTQENYTLMKRDCHKREFPNTMLNATTKISMEHCESTPKKFKFGSSFESHSGQPDTSIPPK